MEYQQFLLDIIFSYCKSSPPYTFILITKWTSILSFIRMNVLLISYVRLWMNNAVPRLFPFISLIIN